MKRLPYSSTLAALALVGLSWSTPASARQASLFDSDRAEISAVADRSAYLGGETARIAVLVSITPGWHINSHEPTFEYLIPTALRVEGAPDWPPAEVDYPPGVMKTFAFEEHPLSVYDDQVVILARVTVPSNVEPGSQTLTVSLGYQACDDRTCLPPTEAAAIVQLSVGEPGQAINQQYFEAAATVAGSPQTTGRAGKGLPLFLLLGLLGGLLLNAMPCVLPVLSLKLMGLVKAAGVSRRSVVTGSLATATGIVVSFWLLAAAAVVAKLAGAGVGWGIQFQQPVFVVFLTVVVLLFCLNLWGLFDVPLPSRIAGWADARGSRDLPAHFTAGLFATLLATPCSAPFLGTAVGFGLTQSAATIFAVFTAIGVGMALPYLALAVAPRAVGILPKPGAWMEHFKHFMGFLLAGAAVWLLYVLSSQLSRERLAFVELALLGLALFIWMRHRGRSSKTWRSVATVGILGTALGALALAAKAPPPETAVPGSAKTPGIGTESSGTLLDWQTFDRQEAERLASSGRLVFVDVTADWCFTCKVNERLVLETPQVAAAFQEFDVLAMKADWTNRDDDIAQFLADHGRYGIPFYLLYRPGQEPHLFGELITKDGVVEVITAAANGAARGT